MTDCAIESESLFGMPVPDFRRGIAIEPFIVGGAPADREVAAKYLRWNWPRLAAEAWINYQQIGRCVVVVPWDRAKASVIEHDPRPITIGFATFKGQTGGALTAPAFVEAGKKYVPEREVLFLFAGELGEAFAFFAWAGLLPAPVDAAKALAN